MKVLKLDKVNDLVRTAAPQVMTLANKDITEPIKLAVEKVGRANTQPDNEGNTREYLYIEAAIKGKSHRFFTSLLNSPVLTPQQYATLLAIPKIEGADKVLAWSLQDNTALTTLLDNVPTLYERVISENDKGEQSLSFAAMKSFSISGFLSYGFRKDDEGNKLEEHPMVSLPLYKEYKEYRDSLDDGERPSYNGMIENNFSSELGTSRSGKQYEGTNPNLWSGRYIIVLDK